MVGVVLRVVEFHQKAGRLNPIIMSLARLHAPGPREVQIATGLLDLLFARSSIWSVMFWQYSSSKL